MPLYLNKETEDNEEVEDYDCTKVIGNEIFYFGDITPENVLDFTEKFRKLESGLLKMGADIVGYTPSIRINIMSDGGDLFSGFTAMNLIQKSRVHVITCAQGACCSAATFMLLGGKERKIGRNAHILIHQLSTGSFWGKFEEMKDEMRTASKFMDMIKDTYTTHTKIPEKKLKKLLKRDIYLVPEECIKYAIVDDYD
jgi:ATP-dependent protease ClpP protease subunit